MEAIRQKYNLTGQSKKGSFTGPDKEQFPSKNLTFNKETLLPHMTSFLHVSWWCTEDNYENNVSCSR